MMLGLFNKYRALSMTEAKKELESDKSIVLIDVRTGKEYREGHIQNSINIPLNEIERAADMIKHKDARIFVYCQSGARSSNACKMLSQMGFLNVTNIGGISSWPYGIVKD